MTAKSKTSTVSRRKFISTSAAAGIGILGAPAILNAQNKGDKLRSSGNIYVGTERKLLVSGDYGDSSKIIPADDAYREFAMALKEKTGDHRPARVYEPSIGHHTEWREAAMGNYAYDYPGSSFKYAGPFTETIQLGNICLHHPGKSLAWDFKLDKA